MMSRRVPSRIAFCCNSDNPPPSASALMVHESAGMVSPRGLTVCQKRRRTDRQAAHGYDGANGARDRRGAFSMLASPSLQAGPRHFGVRWAYEL